MPDRITKLQRWLDLIAYLLGRRMPVPVEEIMERVPAYAEKWATGDDTARATARRTFERDKDELRRFGIPIETVAHTINYGRETVEAYRLARRDFYLPYLKLLAELGAGGARGAAGSGAGAAGGAAGPAAGGAAAHAACAAGTAQAGEGGRAHAGAGGTRRAGAGGTAQAGAETVEIAEEDARDALKALRRVAGLPSFPFEREARSAFRKLSFDLDPERFRATPLLHVDRPGAAELLERLRPLTAALLARKRVRFRYHGIYRGEPTDREVAPYGLIFTRGHWYLVGHDATRDAVRVFRVGRMEMPEVSPTSPRAPDYEIPRGFRLEDYTGRDPWELGGDGDDPLRAHVLFRFPSSLWAARNKKGELVEEREDGSAVRSFDVHQVSPFLRWLLTFEGEALVLSPPALAAELRAHAREVAAIYGGPPSGSWAPAEADRV